MEAQSALRIDRKSSIESEPRTLSIHQIQCAREAAMYVVSTRSVEEAMTIFTKGLEPVVSVGRDDEINKQKQKQKQGRILMNLNPRDMGEYLEEGMRDVASAPF